MKLKPSYIVIGLLVIIFILGCILIFRKPAVIHTDNQKELDRLTNNNKMLMDETLILNNQVDSLYKVQTGIIEIKTIIKHIYHDQIKNVVTADSNQLDSIIRANWN